MKRIMASIMLALAFVSASKADLYPKTATIVDINSENDFVTVEDVNGNWWAFYGAEDYSIGDMVSLIMDDNETEIIYDDEIVMTRYSGFTMIR